MKYKKLLIMAVMSLIGLCSLHAKEDVTSQYLVNADLSAVGETWQYVKCTDWQRASDASHVNVVEFWAGSNYDEGKFKFYQEITLPAGYYRLAVNAFYRNGQGGDGTNNDNAWIFAGTKTQPVVALSGMSELYNYEGSNDLWYASNAFQLGNYSNEFDFLLETEQTIEIGFAGQNFSNNSWCILGPVKLYRYDESEVIKPTNIGLRIAGVPTYSLDMTVGGENQKLTAAVVPSDALNKRVSWASSDPSVARVTSDGVVIAVGEGTAKITATSVADETVVSEPCVVTVTAEPHNPSANVTSSLEDGDYYIFSVLTGKYLGGANDWGTQASLLEHGIPFTLKNYEDGSSMLNSHTYNNAYNHYLGSNGYVDSYGSLYIQDTGGGRFTISTAKENGNYLTASLNSSVLYFSSSNPNSIAAQWYFISKADMEAGLASAYTPSDVPSPTPFDDPEAGDGSVTVDATFLIRDPGFSRNLLASSDNNWWNVYEEPYPWNLDNEDNISYMNLKYGPEKNQYAFIDGSTGTVGSFKVSQKLLVPNGTFKLRAQAVVNETTTQAYIFANNQQVPFKALEADDLSRMNTTNATASDFFSEGKYWTSWVYVTVTDHRLTIGAKSSDDMAFNEMASFDNFELYMTNFKSPFLTSYVDAQGVKYSLDVDQEVWKVTGVTSTCNEDIVIPSKIEETPVGAIEAMNDTEGRIKTLTIAGSVTTINNVVCPGMQTVEFEEGVTYIGEEAFQNCTNLQTIILPATLTQLGYGAFYGSEVLSSVTVKATTPAQIEWNSFGNSYVDATLLVPEEALEDYQNAETWSNFLTTVPIGTFVPALQYFIVDGIRYHIMTDRPAPEVEVLPKRVGPYYKGEFVIPSSVTYEQNDYPVTTIGENAFSECSELTAVSIPSSVKTIKSGAFLMWNEEPQLQTITLQDGVDIALSEEYDVFSPSLYEDADLFVPVGRRVGLQSTYGWNRFHHIYEAGETAEDRVRYFVEDGIRYHITSSAADNKTVEVVNNEKNPYSGELVLPGEVTHEGVTYQVTAVGNLSFNENITSVVLSEGIQTLSFNSFQGCSNLATVSLPTTLTNIDDAFNQCSNITRIDCPITVPVYAYFSSEVYDQARVYVPSKSYDAYRNMDCWMRFRYLIPYNLCIQATGNGSVTVAGKQVKNGLLYMNVENASMNPAVLTIVPEKGYEVGNFMVSCELKEAEDMLLEIQDDGTYTLEFMYDWTPYNIEVSFIKVMPHSLDELANNQAYTISCARAQLGTDKVGNFVAGLKLEDESEPVLCGKQFIIYNYYGNYFLYDYDSRQFICSYKYYGAQYSDNYHVAPGDCYAQLGDNANDAQIVITETGNWAYPFRISFGQDPMENILNVWNGHIPYGLLIDNDDVDETTMSRNPIYTAPDDGNRFRFVPTDAEVSAEVQREILSMIQQAVGYTPLTDLALIEDKVELLAGTTCQLNPVFTPADPTWKKVTWSSDDPSVADVDENGVVTGVAEGVTTVTAQWNDGNDVLEASCSVTVTDELDFADAMTGETLTYSNNIEEGKPIVLKNINYTREFKNTNWQALFLPFTMCYDDWKDDFEVARINSFYEADLNENGVIDDDEVRLTMIYVKPTASNPNPRLRPNYPYMIRAKEKGEQTLVVKNPELYKSEDLRSIDCSTVDTKYTFWGTYHEVTNMKTNGYYAMSGGKLCRATSDDVTLKPFRWYLTADPREDSLMPVLPSAIKLMFLDEEDGELTEIVSLQDDSEIEADGNEGWYTINGVKLSGRPAASGVYIWNGKKVVIE